MRRAAARWLLGWAAWTALGVVIGVGNSLTYVTQDRPPIWLQSIGLALAQWWLWAALTPIVFVCAWRWPLAPGALVARLPLHLAIGFAIAFVKVTIEGRIRRWMFGVAPYLLINNLFLQVLIYFALVTGAQALDRFGRARARAAEAEARLGEARLELLRAQLQPHFLFNALNAIAELVHEDPERADRMIGRLSDLLRAALDAGDRPQVPLDEELGLVERYLDLQRARFGDRLAVSIDVPAECGRAIVPHFLLQPLVENAVVHGVASRSDACRVKVSAVCRGSTLELRVDDDGVGFAGSVPVDGVGLTNTRKRLESLYGDKAALRVERRADGGVRSAVELPYSASAAGVRG
ncbi:MAG TPA: histidine kinase [Vicinamibacterales bacterium]|nr:histidine kinase [Vicinamibacterales bacterium]